MKKLPKVIFLGSKRLGLSCLKEMYAISPDVLEAAITIDDSSDTRTVLNDFKLFCTSKKIPFFVAKNRKHSEELVRTLNPDIGIVIGWYWLISSDIIHSAKFIGLHNSLLPRYRGVSPLNWAIIHGEKKVGISLFTLTDTMDAGDIWAQRTVDVGEHDYIGDVLSAIEKEGIEVIQSVYESILLDRIKPTPQNHAQASFCVARTPEDGLINWDQHSKNIYNFIRAQSKPYPGAFTYVDGKKVTIWKAAYSDVDHFGVPGQVCRITEEGIWVACADYKALILQDIELEGDTSNANMVISYKTKFKNE